jgi:hypothetical protein
MTGIGPQDKFVLAQRQNSKKENLSHPGKANLFCRNHK